MDLYQANEFIRGLGLAEHCHKYSKDYHLNGKVYHRYRVADNNPITFPFVMMSPEGFAVVEEEELEQKVPDFQRKPTFVVQGGISSFAGKYRTYLTPGSGAKMTDMTEDPVDVEARRMARTAIQTARNSNGQEVQTTIKDKRFLFPSEEDLVRYVAALIVSQNGRCAITGLPLQYGGRPADDKLRCSLDRIDSDRDYEPGNLQVVCRFINMWKSDENNDEFKRLIELVQQAAGNAAG